MAARVEVTFWVFSSPSAYLREKQCQQIEQVDVMKRGFNVKQASKACTAVQNPITKAMCTIRPFLMDEQLPACPCYTTALAPDIGLLFTLQNHSKMLVHADPARKPLALSFVPIAHKWNYSMPLASIATLSI